MLSCPAAATLDAWLHRDWSGGVQIDRLQNLDAIAVRTENNLYEIVVLDSGSGEILVRGGRFFPEHTRARLAGSSLGGSFLKLKGIYVGFSMEIQHGRPRIVTSRVQSIQVLAASPA
jgi:hypothetical protein